MRSVTRVARAFTQDAPALASARAKMRRKHPAGAEGSEGSGRLNCTEGTCVVAQAGGYANPWPLCEGAGPSAALYLRSLKTNLGSAKAVTALSKDNISAHAQPIETAALMIIFNPEFTT